jgi:phage minor structural protein
MIHIVDKISLQIVAVLENKLGASAYWNDEHQEELKTNTETFDFTTIDGTAAAQFLTSNNMVLIQDEDGFFRPFSIWHVRKLSDRTIEVKTNLDHYNLAKQKIIVPQVFEGQTINTILDTILNGTDWQRGKTETNDVRTITIKEHTNPLAVIHDLKSLFDLELRFRCEINRNRITARHVDMIKQTGTYAGKEIVLGKDLQSIERFEDSDNICTALWVVGPQDSNGNTISIASVNDGKEFVEDVEALSRWSKDGRHIWGIYTPDVDSDITPAELLTLATEEIKKRVNASVSYEVAAADLENILGLSHEKVRLGDTVRIKDEKFSPPLFLEARILDIKRSISDKTRKEFLLGDYADTHKMDPLRKMNSQVRELSSTLVQNTLLLGIADNDVIPNNKEYVRNCITFFSERLADEKNKYFLTGARRSVQLRKPDKDFTYHTEVIPDNGLNCTPCALSLETVSLFIKQYPEQGANLMPILEELARYLMSLQWTDERTARYGGFSTSDSLGSARAFGTGKAMNALLAAYEVTKNPKYLASCERAAIFLSVLANPNPKYQALYGSTPIPNEVENTGFAGFCDQVQSDDTINVICTTWNLTATKALYKLWQVTGKTEYKTLCDQTRDWMAYGVINGYDYFSIKNTAPGSKVSTSWPNLTSGLTGDGIWHRLGDYVDTSTVGTDQIEYGLEALWVTGYDTQLLKNAYEFYCSLPPASPETSFGSNYDSSICWTGYFRINSPVYNGESKAFGSYYDSQGAGTLLAFKKALYPDHYTKSLPLLAVLPNAGALINENLETIYSTGDGYVYATKGVIPIACAAIGLLQSLGVN